MSPNKLLTYFCCFSDPISCSNFTVAHMTMFKMTENGLSRDFNLCTGELHYCSRDWTTPHFKTNIPIGKQKVHHAQCIASHQSQDGALTL